MKAKNKTLRGMTVILMAVILFTTIFAIPVPNANAADAMPQQLQTYTKLGTIWSKINGGFTALDERGQLWAFDADPDSFIVIFCRGLSPASIIKMNASGFPTSTVKIGSFTGSAHCSVVKARHSSSIQMEPRMILVMTISRTYCSLIVMSIKER